MLKGFLFPSPFVLRRQRRRSKPVSSRLVILGWEGAEAGEAGTSTGTLVSSGGGGGAAGSDAPLFVPAGPGAMGGHGRQRAARSGRP